MTGLVHLFICVLDRKDKAVVGKKILTERQLNTRQTFPLGKCDLAEGGTGRASSYANWCQEQCPEQGLLSAESMTEIDLWPNLGC